MYLTAPSASTYCDCCNSMFVKDKRIFFFFFSGIPLSGSPLRKYSFSAAYVGYTALRNMNTWGHVGQSVGVFFFLFAMSFPPQTDDHYISCSYLLAFCAQYQATMTALSVRVFNGSLKCFLFLCCLIIILCVSSVNG